MIRSLYYLESICWSVSNNNNGIYIALIHSCSKRLVIVFWNGIRMELEFDRVIRVKISEILIKGKKIWFDLARNSSYLQ